MAKAKRSLKERFKEMDRDQRAELVREHMRAGGSYKKAAAEFGTTVGLIAGICRDYGISSTHPPAFEHVQKTWSGQPLRVALNEKVQCVAVVDGRQCGYEKAYGTEYCGLPQHQELAKRARKQGGP